MSFAQGKFIFFKIKLKIIFTHFPGNVVAVVGALVALNAIGFLLYAVVPIFFLALYADSCPRGKWDSNWQLHFDDRLTNVLHNAN